MTCSVQQKADKLKELSEIYTKDVRALLSGRGVVEKNQLDSIIDYLAELEINKGKQAEATRDFDSKMLRTFNEGDAKHGYRLTNTTNIGNKPAPAKNLVKLGRTVFTDMDFLLPSDVENKVLSEDDLSYVISEAQEEEFLKVKTAILNILEANNIETAGADIKWMGKRHFKALGDISGVITNSPAIGLLVRKVSGNDYEINVGAALTVASSLNASLADNTGNLLGYKDDSMIADIVGVQEDEVTDYLRYRFSNGGMGLSLFADDVGKRVVSSLGLQFINPELKTKDTKKVVSSFGLVAAEMLDQNDSLAEKMKVDLDKVVSLAAEEFSGTLPKDLLEKLKSRKESQAFWDIYREVPTSLGFTSPEKAKEFRNLLYKHISLSAKGIIFQDIYMPDKGKVKTNAKKGYRAAHRYLILKPGKQTLETIKANAELFSEFTDDYGKVREPRFEKPSKNKIRRKRRDKYSKVSELQEKYLSTAESIPYKYNSGMDLLMKKMEGKSEEEVRKVLRAALEYPETREDVSKTMSIGNTSRQTRVDRIIDDNLALYEKAKKEGNPFYFDYFVPGSNRAMIDSSTVNPHADKHMARWLVSQEGIDKAINYDELQSLMSQDVLAPEQAKSMNPTLLATMLGTVQGFDGNSFGGAKVADIEKNTLQEVFESFKRIVDSTAEELDSNVFSSDGHLGQKLTAAHVVEAYRNNDKVINSDVTYEVDGLTNALFYRLLQTPMAGYKDKLEKVGVLTEAGDAEHMGDIKAGQEDYMDNYMTMSSIFRENIKRAERSLPEEAKVLIDNELFIFKDFEEKVTKDMRNFAKPGTMIVNYGAGVNKIVQQAVDDYLNGSMGNAGLLDKLVEKKGDKYVVSDEVVKKLTGTNNVQKFRNDILQQESDQIQGSKEYAKLQATVKKMVGEQVEVDGKFSMVGPFSEALEEMFGPYIELSNLSSTFYNELYSVFMVKLGEELGVPVGEDGDTTSLEAAILKASAKEIKDAVKKLNRYFPSLVRPDTVVVDTNTTVIGKPVGLLTEGDEYIDASTLSRSVAGSQPNTVNGVTSFNASFLVDTFSKPGAKALPFDTHTRDSRDIMESSLKAFEESGAFPLQVFDALVIDGATGDTAKMHNESAMMNNLRSSSFEDMFMRLRDVAEKTGYAPLIEVKEKVESAYNAVVSNRQEVYGKNQAVFQMSGTVKSRYDYVSSEVLEKETKRLEKAFKELEAAMNAEVLEESNPELWNRLTELKNLGPDTESGRIVPMIYEISWVGLGQGELADVLQTIRESDTAVRTIKGIKILSTETSKSLTEVAPAASEKKTNLNIVQSVICG